MTPVRWMSAALAVIAVVTLAGCATEEARVRIADTKPSTQLLRNELSSRIPADAIETVGAGDDTSIDCGEGGVMRSWRASQLLFITPDSAPYVTSMMVDLVTSLEAEGWTETRSEPSRKIRVSRMNSTRTASVIFIETTQAADNEGNGASLEITVTGPCVRTDGPESDEVLQLDRRT